MTELEIKEFVTNATCSLLHAESSDNDSVVDKMCRELVKKAVADPVLDKELKAVFKDRYLLWQKNGESGLARIYSSYANTHGNASENEGGGRIIPFPRV